MTGYVAGTGVHQEVSRERFAAVNARMDALLARAQRDGEHIWVALVGYRVVPPLGPGTLLDVDNLVVPPQVGCYRCEQEYSALLAGRQCPGDPS